MARKSNTKWTEEDDRRLLELRAVGKSALSIGLALGRFRADWGGIESESLKPINGWVTVD
ncbi:MAG: hypothetical protein H0W86_12590 [Armatimonadetes bacterium]|nr:hypothetical protein [Armatimonadota bacterium]